MFREQDETGNISQHYRMTLGSGAAWLNDSGADPADSRDAADEPAARAPADKAPARKPPENPAETAPSAAPSARADATPETPARQGWRKRVLIGTVTAIVLAAGGWYGTHWWTTGRFMISTDDAYVRANNTTLAAKVSGYVTRIAVDDNAAIHAGDVIATIDDGDYRLAVEAARDKVATQQATVDRIGRQIVAQGAAIAQTQAQLTSADAASKRNQLELDRQQKLAANAYASKQALEQAEANRDQGVAAVQSARAAVDAAQANLDVLKAQQQEAARVLDELRTAQAKAERDLSFAVIRAPIDGVFGNRAVQTGDFVQIGQRIASLVPLDAVYVDANFKETQLAGLQPGQRVSIAVDALPDHDIAGTVASLSPASGAVFSLLPPDNATGNFTKIVQRLPVRIAVPAGVTTQRLLRPGMSVTVSVDTKASASPPTAVAERATTVRQ